MTGPQRRTLQLAGHSVPGLVAGPREGRPVVLLHGSADSPGCWRSVMAGLAQRGWRTWAPAVPAAWHPGDEHALDVDLPFIAAVLAHSDEGRPVRLVGHSYGALAALRYTLDAPESVSHLGLFEPIAFGLLDALPGGRGAMAELQQRFFDPVRRGDPARGLGWLVDYWNGDGAWDRLPADARARLAAGVERVVAEVSSGFADGTHAEELRGLRTPTLVVAGQHTTREALTVCEQLHLHLPRATHLLVSGAGHQMTRTHPGPVVEALDSLFNEPA